MGNLYDYKVVIYGIGGNGNLLYDCLKNKCEVIGFIDKRAKEVKEFCLLPVLTPQDAARFYEDKENIVVFITVKNVFLHTDIAKTLLNQGFHQIIYKTEGVLKGHPNECEKEIDVLYESLIEKKSSVEFARVPYISGIRNQLTDRLLIETTGEKVKTWCPVELLFNYKNANDYPGLNMPLFFPLVELYKFLLGDTSLKCEDVTSNYVIYCCEWLKINGRELTETQRESFLESRISAFSEMQKMAEVDIDFYKRNCPSVLYEKGKFYLSSSGRNRVSFLIAKGFKYVPVVMSVQDYENWIDRKWIDEIEEKIKKDRISSFFASYPNPYLIDLPVDFPDYQRLFIWPIANYITKKIYMECRIVEGSLTVLDHRKIEKRKSQITVMCDIDDNQIAKKYFSNIGYRVGKDNLEGESYLVTDSKVPNATGDKFNMIFVLKRENCENSLVVPGYKQTKRMFYVICKNGPICADIYERMR